MIEIPIGKALIAVGNGIAPNCRACEIYNVVCFDKITFACFSRERKDGKNVTIKLVDYPDVGNKLALHKEGV